jgi:hypothetical protein
VRNLVRVDPGRPPQPISKIEVLGPFEPGKQPMATPPQENGLSIQAEIPVKYFSVGLVRFCGSGKKGEGRFMNNPKERAHALLDLLPEEKLTAVVGLLEVMVEPLSRSLASAPVEDEEITPDTAAAIERARASLARGEGIPHEDVRHEFGL